MIVICCIHFGIPTEGGDSLFGDKYLCSTGITAKMFKLDKNEER